MVPGGGDQKKSSGRVLNLWSCRRSRRRPVECFARLHARLRINPSAPFCRIVNHIFLGGIGQPLNHRISDRNCSARERLGFIYSCGVTGQQGLARGSPRRLSVGGVIEPKDTYFFFGGATQLTAEPLTPALTQWFSVQLFPSKILTGVDGYILSRNTCDTTVVQELYEYSLIVALPSNYCSM